MQAGQALDALLRGLGVPGEHIPPGAEERAGLYRSALAQLTGPVLVIADNASSEGQVRLLLPGPGPHKVIVTSRHTLAGLGARQLDVTVLDQESAFVLLDRVLRAARPGDARITASPQDAAALARVCGGLPLALQITAALLVADPSLTVAELGSGLADEVHRLEELAYDEGSGSSPVSVAAAFELSYRQLGVSAARMFRLMAVHPGLDLSAAVAAVLAGEPVGRARRVISQLVRAHLVELAAEAVGGRWRRMHDLLRLYARQLSDPDAEPGERDQARDRLLGYYLRQAGAADEHLRALAGTPVPPEFTGREDALAWLDAERPSLIAAITMAAGTGRFEAAMRLPLSLHEYLGWRRRFDDSLTILAISRDAAQRLNNRSEEAIALTDLGTALRQVRRFEEAITACQDAAAIYRETGDRHGEGMALGNLGFALQGARRPEEAITAFQDAVELAEQIG